MLLHLDTCVDDEDAWGSSDVRGSGEETPTKDEIPESWEQAASPTSPRSTLTEGTFEEVKGKKKSKKKGPGGMDEGFGFGKLEITNKEKPVDPKAPFGGRKVFVGGTADRDQEELKAHFRYTHETRHAPVGCCIAVQRMYSNRCCHGLLELAGQHTCVECPDAVGSGWTGIVAFVGTFFHAPSMPCHDFSRAMYRF